jgi:HPt (histidine-containing phosphotransfer) domain-containing protein
MVDFSKLPAGFVDLDDAINRVGGDEDFYAELLEDLRALGDDCLPKLRNALETSNAVLLNETAHMLKGAAGNLGLKRLQDYTLQLEMMGKENNFKDAFKLINLTEKEFEILAQFLDSH